MIEFILFIWVSSILGLSLINLKWSLYAYIPYIILVPYMNIHIGGLSLQWNLVNLLLMLVYFLKYKQKGIYIEYKPLKPFLFFLGISLLMMPLQSVTPSSFAMNEWRVSLFKIIFVPFLILNVARQEPQSIKFLRYTVLVSIAIASLYGLFLTTTGGLNPYLLLMMDANGEEFNLDYAEAFGEGRLFGRISSVFTHPMTYGLFLGLALIYVYFNRDKINKYLSYFFISIVALNILFCGVRSVIGAVGIAFIYYLFIGRQYKLMIISIICLFIIPYFIAMIPELSNYLGSIVDFEQKSTDVGGSSMEMRIEQFFGCFDIIKNNPLFGNGFEWTQYYYVKNGNHPVLLAFESLIFVVLCDSGYVGVLLWICMVVMFYKISRCTFFGPDSVVFFCLVIFYLIYSCITGCGITQYMSIFAMFYALIYIERNNIINE